MGAGPDAPFYMKFLAGAITGGVGSVIGNPFDVLKVRNDLVVASKGCFLGNFCVDRVNLRTIHRRISF